MRKIRTSLLACLLVLSMSIIAFAAEPPQTVIDTDENGTSITITDITPREDEENEQTTAQKTNGYQVGSFYPIEIQTAEENGIRLLVKTFLVPQDTDPAALIEEGLTRRGVEYQVSDILKRELAGESESRMVTETVTVPAETDDADELAELFTGTIPYSQDGFAGTLTLEPASIKTKATDTEGYAYTLKDVKEFSGLDRNDPYYIPKTAQKNGVTLQLADVRWEPMASAAENSEVPSLFSATATYTGTAWGSKASGYLATASYSGEVSKASEGELLVSVVYEEIPAEKAAAPINWNNLLMPVLGIVLGAGLLAGGWFGGKWLLARRGQKKPAQPVGSDPYAGRPTMDTPELLYEMDRGLEEDR